MEDGTVSIFGLVFGVAASTSDSRVVLVAGMTGAIAAAVSMMAGAYLDAETARDQARVERASRRASTTRRCSRRSRCADRLLSDGLPPAAVDALDVVARDYPGTAARAARPRSSRRTATARSPLAHALWMFVSDLVAALVPVFPFALLPIAQAQLRIDRVHGGRAHRPRHRPRADRQAGACCRRRCRRSASPPPPGAAGVLGRTDFVQA